MTGQIIDETISEEDNKEERMKLRDSISELRDCFKEEYEFNQDLYLKQDYDCVMDTSDDSYCIRYLRHFKMNTDKALNGMKHNLSWRKQFKIDELSIECFPKELLLFVPIFVCGKSVDGCPIIYIQGAEFSPSSPGPVRELLRSYFYHLMKILDESLGPMGQVHVVLNQTNSSLLHNFELDALKWLVGIRDNWPSRVKSVRVIGLPFVFRPIVKMVVSWLPKEWSDILFVGTVQELLYSIVDDENIPSFFGGPLDAASCKLAPTSNKWAKDFELFKDQEMFDKLMKCFYLSEDVKNHLIDLQREQDKKNKSLNHCKKQSEVTVENLSEL